MENSSAYLFPFIVEYSIIGSHVLYSMWRNIGKNPEYLMLGDDSTEDEHTGWPISIIYLFAYSLISLREGFMNDLFAKWLTFS